MTKIDRKYPALIVHDLQSVLDRICVREIDSKVLKMWMEMKHIIFKANNGKTISKFGFSGLGYSLIMKSVC